MGIQYVQIKSECMPDLKKNKKLIHYVLIYRPWLTWSEIQKKKEELSFTFSPGLKKLYVATFILRWDLLSDFVIVINATGFQILLLGNWLPPFSSSIKLDYTFIYLSHMND